MVHENNAYSMFLWSYVSMFNNIGFGKHHFVLDIIFSAVIAILLNLHELENVIPYNICLLQNKKRVNVLIKIFKIIKKYIVKKVMFEI